MASFTERLAYLITANGRDAIREFRNVRQAADQSLGGVEGRLSRFKATAGGVGAGLKGFGAGIAASFGAAAVGDMVRAASDLEQSAGAVESVFGDAAATITEFGETAAQTAGLSKSQVNQMAAVVGASLKGMGLDAQTAAEQVVILQRRAADLAAQFGGTTESAIDAMASALRGERDPIERYGVSIRATDVAARAAAMGLDRSTAAADKQATAFATLSLILDSSKDSVDAFRREQDTLAGSTARAAADFENAKADFGKSIEPLATESVKGANRFVQGINSMVEKAKELDRSPVGRFLRNAFGVKLPKEPEQALDDLGTAAERAAADQKKLEEAAKKAATAVEDEAEKTRNAVTAIEAFSEAIDGTVGARLDARSASRAFADAEEQLQETLRGTSDGLEETTERARTYQEAQRDIFSSVVDLDQAHVRAKDAVTELAEALQQGGMNSEDAAAYMKRYYKGGMQDASKFARGVTSATASAVQAAEAEVEALVESGAIADTAGDRKKALMERLVALKNQFPAVAAQVDRYIAALQRVPNLSTKSEDSTKKLGGAKRDLAADIDGVVAAAKREADMQGTAVGRYQTMIDKLEALKRKYPELTAVFQKYIDDTNEAWRKAWANPNNNSLGAEWSRNPPWSRTQNALPTVNGVSGPWSPEHVINVNVNGAGLSLEALGTVIARQLGFQMNQGRR